MPKDAAMMISFFIWPHLQSAPATLHLLPGTVGFAITAFSVGVKGQRTQSEDRFQSRLERALTWKVLGICVKSSRMRIRLDRSDQV